MTTASTAQENVTTVGIQFKPMVPSSFFNTGPETTSGDDLELTFTPRFGMSLGMVVRRGLSRNWSLETGINMVQRNFKVDLQYPGLPKGQQLNFRYIAYEIPVQGIIFVKLGEQLYMNASGGVSLDMYPTGVVSSGSAAQDTMRYDYQQHTFRNGWLQVALLANYGFEYRTREKGYFYIGASYHRPFTHIGTSRVEFTNNTEYVKLLYRIKGSYLTADFRYFFNEKAERKKPK
jgi:hypothetical protein